MLVLWSAWSHLNWDPVLVLHWPFDGGRWWEAVWFRGCVLTCSVLVRKPQLALSQKLLWADFMVMYVNMVMISSYCKMGKSFHGVPYPDIPHNKECHRCVCACICVHVCVREL